MSVVLHGEDAIFAGRSERDGLAAEGFADPPRLVLEADPASDIDLADDVACGVLDRRRRFGVRPWAHAIAIGRHGKVDRFMRALAVVDRPPAIEGLLTLGEITEAPTIEHLGNERGGGSAHPCPGSAGDRACRGSP